MAYSPDITKHEQTRADEGRESRSPRKQESLVRQLTHSPTLTPSMAQISGQDLTVELRGFVSPPAFDLGGKHGNVVTTSRTNIVHKGWRVVAVDGQALAPEGVATAIIPARERTRYSVTFRIVEEEDSSEDAEQDKGIVRLPQIAPTAESQKAEKLLRGELYHRHQKDHWRGRRPPRESSPTPQGTPRLPPISGQNEMPSDDDSAADHTFGSEVPDFYFALQEERPYIIRGNVVESWLAQDHELREEFNKRRHAAVQESSEQCRKNAQRWREETGCSTLRLQAPQFLGPRQPHQSRRPQKFVERRSRAQLMRLKKAEERSSANSGDSPKLHRRRRRKSETHRETVEFQRDMREAALQRQRQQCLMTEKVAQILREEAARPDVAKKVNKAIRVFSKDRTVQAAKDEEDAKEAPSESPADATTQDEQHLMNSSRFRWAHMPSGLPTGEQQARATDEQPDTSQEQVDIERGRRRSLTEGAMRGKRSERMQRIGVMRRSKTAAKEEDLESDFQEIEVSQEQDAFTGNMSVFDMCLNLSRSYNVRLTDVKRIYQEFEELDVNGDGTLDKKEFEVIIRDKCKIPEGTEVPPHLALQIFDRVAQDGRLTFKDYFTWQFRSGWKEDALVTDEASKELRKLARDLEVTLLDVEYLKSLFDYFDTDGSGMIDQEEFKGVIMKSMKVHDPSQVSDKMLQRYWREADINNRGELGVADFMTWYIMHYAT
eukprot:TRINITY_DN8702_c0_g1_i2.p1 TRINITY_DN8702_c0_g1~~TRINITY_DN8702_c0_g1_i2.p1  ORF type:complete len:717 (-),score=141.44 TRINITY_DN8702_c0_g1_i2:107-2257(-)